MSKAKYPKIGRISKVGKTQRRNGKLCDCCDKPAVTWMDVQVSWFRGEDEVLKLCEEHTKIAKESDKTRDFDIIWKDQEAEKKKRQEVQKVA